MGQFQGPEKKTEEEEESEEAYQEGDIKQQLVAVMSQGGNNDPLSRDRYKEKER